jgi:hypothetical protein
MIVQWPTCYHNYLISCSFDMHILVFAEVFLSHFPPFVWLFSHILVDVKVIFHTFLNSCGFLESAGEFRSSSFTISIICGVLTQILTLLKIFLHTFKKCLIQNKFTLYKAFAISQNQFK